MKRLNQSGSYVIGIALLVLVLAVIGFTGYKVAQSHKKVNDASSGPVTHSAPVAIRNTADLQKTSEALDDSSAQLNSDLNDSSLNADLNSML